MSVSDPSQEGAAHHVQAPEELPGRGIAAEQYLRDLQRDLQRKRRGKLLSELQRASFGKSDRPGVAKNVDARALGFVSRRVPPGAVRLSSQTNEASRSLLRSILKHLECTEFREFDFTSM